MNELLARFQTTFEDKHFSRAERQQVRKLLKAEKLSARELAVLRSKIFDLARAELEQLPAPAVLGVLDWLENANKLLLPQHEAPTTNEVYFSPGEECRQAIISHIQKATSKLDVCVFTISDNPISRELMACHRKGVRLRILTDNDKRYDAGSDIEELAQAGIPVRIDRSEKHMHHKFALIDGHTLLTGSYNWTRSAATHNEENLLVTRDPFSVKAYQREFDNLWKKMKVYG
ncbi:MAG: DUF1669 domain-containing protein [Bacteroidetes bacterium]|nr:MAG: DUF1669 domain-containing protein [Bacteroidota bacterium]